MQYHDSLKDKFAISPKHDLSKEVSPNYKDDLSQKLQQKTGGSIGEENYALFGVALACVGLIVVFLWFMINFKRVN